MTEKAIQPTPQNSKWIMASYQTFQFFSQFITGPFGLFTFFFYEAEIGLNVGLVALAFIIFSVWNAINDPLIGYILERIHMPWERKLGRRFPWILFGAIPWLFSYLAVFLVPLEWDPVDDQWLVFLWLLIMICLYDTLFTLWNINAVAIYPDKFTTLEERRTCTGIGTIIGMAGIVAGSIFAPLFITTGVPESYRYSAWLSVAVAMCLFVLMIPGTWENKVMRKRYEEQKQLAEKSEMENFFSIARQSITDRRFMTKVIFFFGYQCAVAFLSASAPYMVTFVIQEQASALSILMALMLVGAFVSVPLWNFFAQKMNNNKKISIYAGFAMVITFLPIFFANNFIFFIIALFLFGIGLGGQWYVDPPAMADVIDDLSVRTGKRQPAIYYGINAFFIRLSTVAQALVFAVIHNLTGFVEGVSSYSELVAVSPTPELALLGIRMHAALIPAFIVLVTIFIFWKWYDITPELVQENKRKLKEMGLDL